MHQVQSAERRHYLILATHRVVQYVSLDVDRAISQFGFGDEVPAKRHERVNQPHSEARRRPQSRERWKVRRKVDLNVPLDIERLQYLPEWSVLDFRDMLHTFHLSVSEADRVIEQRGRELRDGMINVLVNSRREDRPAMALEELRKVRPSAEETDTKRRLTNDHFLSSLTSPTYSALRASRPR